MANTIAEDLLERGRERGVEQGELRMARQTVRDALEAPLTWLVRNAGRHPAPILAEARPES